MSRAGKFIPGGSGRRASGSLPKGADGAGPIRVPDGLPGATPAAGVGRKLFPKGGLRAPVPKKNRLPITIMSAVVFGFLLWFAQYTWVTRPAQMRAQAAEIAQQQAQQALAADQAAQKAKADAAAKLDAEKITVKVDSNPTGATVTLGPEQKTTPATFTGVAPGTIDLLIHLEGYRDYQQKITAQAAQPLDLGVIPLSQRTGSIAFSSTDDGVTYTLTGPANYSHQGSVPDKLPSLPVGVYQLTAQLNDWTLPAVTLTLHPDENLQQEIKVPYATLTLQSAPPGATVRNGRNVLGQTPVTLSQLCPGAKHLSLDLPPYTVAYLDVNLPGFANVSKTVTLTKDKDFVGASGVDMVWIPAGGFWAEKYLMRQSVFETVARYNPSYFRRANRPVENISWDNAVAFCDKLTEYERKAGRLPDGYHYTLPTESQWSTFSADANIDGGATSRSTPLSATQDVGYSEPNKYGLYDTIGNVWEWCLDNFDDKGDRSLRGGNWLSSSADFPDAETRNGAAPTYADRFTGFRVVLVPQSN
jgi:formylglycine-generating enzyme required for sulfatase activity/type II secretory pathway pseudopilin PulG